MKTATACLQVMQKFHYLDENNEFDLWFALCNIHITGKNERKDKIKVLDRGRR
jgi:hypothetical protein